jgi:hypothetical protein
MKNSFFAMLFMHFFKIQTCKIKNIFFLERYTCLKNSKNLNSRMRCRLLPFFHTGRLRRPALGSGSEETYKKFLFNSFPIEWLFSGIQTFLGDLPLKKLKIFKKSGKTKKLSIAKDVFFRN